LEMLALYILFPSIRPGECLVAYDTASPFIHSCVKWCRRLDRLSACRFDPGPSPAGEPSLGLAVIHGARRCSGFEALREIGNVLPATWFLAPALGLPGFAALGDRAYRSLLGRRDTRPTAV
jgi:hypothetical protein